MQIDKYFRHAHVDFERVMNLISWDEHFDVEMWIAKAKLIFMSWLQDSLPVRIQDFSKMPASKLGLATRAFVAVLLALARRYELILHVHRDSPSVVLARDGCRGEPFFGPAHLATGMRWIHVIRKTGTFKKNARAQHPKITLSRDKSFIKIPFKQKSPSPSLES